MFDQQIQEVLNGFDSILDKRIKQIDAVIESRMNQFQEMLNGLKITNQVEMPVVKKSEPV
jgi:hypothetical protein